MKTYLHERSRTYIELMQFYKKIFRKPNPFTRFVRARAGIVDGQLQATPVGLDKSSAVSSLADANAFIVLPGGTRGFEAGMKVSVLLLECTEGSDWPWARPLQSYK